ncbi:MAG: hypothetical protein OSB43_04355 [Nocardioides sp.]|uniref:hypothetical protein n=1 Tax=Nocardioides sp. TaxID=35761 RepID=UPI000C8A7283|nr:hypothetical protein [Nocardioides sp.]MAS55944.1 hypothetical protein [Pimelobacter sp.]MDE0775489.1 hypothetical protein [Nocardioides sp.]
MTYTAEHTTTHKRVDPRRLRIVPDIPRIVYAAPVLAIFFALILIASVMHRPTTTNVPPDPTPTPRSSADR